MQTQSQMNSNNSNLKSFDDRSKSMQFNGKGRNGPNTATTTRGSSLNAIAKPTLSASIKTKYIVRSRHNDLTASRFVPVNQSQAKVMVKKETVHDNGEPRRIDHEIMQRSSKEEAADRKAALLQRLRETIANR